MQCPSCAGALVPRVFACEACGVKVEGRFKLNEFAALGGDDLHFLRIFVRCEGRIRDMEAALGLSYPTVRGRLTALKNKLVEAGEALEAPESSADEVRQTLERLAAGEIAFEEAMKVIKKGK